ncbi:MAG: hypothetical protein ACTSRP_16590 [Candidatus Helarchaeota archaeon]
MRQNSLLRSEIEKEKKLINKNKDKYHNKLNKCKLLSLCGICTNYKQFQCCILKRLKGEISSINCIEINCININDCKKAIEGKLSIDSIPKINNFFNNNYRVRNPLCEFKEPYYPVIQIESKSTLKNQINLIKKLQIRGIVVSLQKIFSVKEEYFIKKPYFCDLHDFLNYDGEIILTTNIADEYCNILIKNSQKIPEMLKRLNPNAFTTFDANFYYTQPTFITLIQLDKIFKTNGKVSNLNIKQIGLVPPIKMPFFKIAILSQLNYNHKTIAIPLQELNKRQTVESRYYKQIINNQCISYASKFKFKFILLSTSPTKKIYANSFSSMSWNIKSKNNWDIREKCLIKYRKKAKSLQPKLGLMKIFKVI